MLVPNFFYVFRIVYTKVLPGFSPVGNKDYNAGIFEIFSMRLTL